MDSQLVLVSTLIDTLVTVKANDLMLVPCMLRTTTFSFMSLLLVDSQLVLVSTLIDSQTSYLPLYLPG